jgi:hypothetical protein
VPDPDLHGVAAARHARDVQTPFQEDALRAAVTVRGRDERGERRVRDERLDLRRRQRAARDRPVLAGHLDLRRLASLEDDLFDILALEVREEKREGGHDR